MYMYNTCIVTTFDKEYLFASYVLLQGRLFEALYDFESEQDGDLNFKQGEVLTIVQTQYVYIYTFTLEITSQKYLWFSGNHFLQTIRVKYILMEASVQSNLEANMIEKLI